jgi:hypothetical protein
MAKFGPQLKHPVLQALGLEVFVSPKKSTKTGGRKVWIRVQGAVGTKFRVYESLGYARSVDVCLQEAPHPAMQARKTRRSGPR